MPKALEEITKDVIELPQHQRLALASFILELDEDSPDSEVDAAWEQEIKDRIQAIDDGKARGIPYEQVMNEAQARLDQ